MKADTPARRGSLRNGGGPRHEPPSQGERARMLEIVRDIDAEVYIRGLSKARQKHPGFAL